MKFGKVILWVTYIIPAIINYVTLKHIEMKLVLQILHLELVYVDFKYHYCNICETFMRC